MPTTLEQEWTVESESLDWASEAKVDDETGVIRNVLLCGNRSKNGYEIPASAFGSDQNVRVLYEGKGVFIDHVPESQLNRPLERSLRDMAGTMRNIRFVGGRPVGDVHTKGCAEAELLLTHARERTPNVGMSHIARYKWNDSQSAVETVREVATVDVVVFPATTSNFSERNHGESTMSDQIYKEQIDSLKGEKKDLVRERDDWKARVDKAEASLAESQASVTSLTEERDKLKSEHTESQAKIQTFESEKAIAQRRIHIKESFKKRDLDADDKAHCSETFHGILMDIEDDAKRESLIKEHAEAVSKAVKGSGGFHGTSERTNSESKDDFDAEAAWDTVEKQYA